MSSAFSHAFVAVLLGKAYARTIMPWRFWELSILCSILPDADVVGFSFGIDYGDLLGHRGLTHSLCFALILGMVIVSFAFRDVAKFSRAWWILSMYFFLVTASHGFLDAMTDEGLGVAFFSPFDTTRYFLPWRPLVCPPISLSNFFGARGLEVMLNEFLWIWVPALTVLGGLTVHRKMTRPAAYKPAPVSDRAVVLDNTFFRVGKGIWQRVFILVVLAFAWWLSKNVVTGTFVRELKYFVPALLLASMCVAALYFMSFRANRQLFLKLHISLATVLVLGVAFETTIRLWDRFDPLFRPSELNDSFAFQPNASSFSPYKPGSVGKTHGNLVRINSLGFRGPEISMPKSENTFRILVLGDSVTFGQGVAESDMYTSLLQEELSSKFQRRSIEVVNLGVIGSSAIDQMKLLKNLGVPLEPDLLLIGFIGDGSREGNHVPDAERLRWALPVPSTIKDFVSRHSKLVRWLTAKYDALLIQAGVRPDVITSMASAYSQQSEEWQRFVEAYENILQWAQTHDLPAPLVGLLLPAARYGGVDRVQLNSSDSEMLRQFKQVEHTLNEMGFYTIDFLPLFQRQNKEDLTVSQWEEHPNAMAHRVYANGFFHAILALDLIGRDEAGSLNQGPLTVPRAGGVPANDVSESAMVPGKLPGTRLE